MNYLDALLNFFGGNRCRCCRSTPPPPPAMVRCAQADSRRPSSSLCRGWRLTRGGSRGLRTEDRRGGSGGGRAWGRLWVTMDAVNHHGVILYFFILTIPNGRQPLDSTSLILVQWEMRTLWVSRRLSPTGWCKCKNVTRGIPCFVISPSNSWGKLDTHFAFDERGNAKLHRLSPRCISEQLPGYRLPTPPYSKFLAESAHSELPLPLSPSMKPRPPSACWGFPRSRLLSTAWSRCAHLGGRRWHTLHWHDTRHRRCGGRWPCGRQRHPIDENLVRRIAAVDSQP
jgi:hypothetical protein